MAARSPRSGLTSVSKFTPSPSSESSIIFWSFGYPGEEGRELPHLRPLRAVEVGVISK